MVPAALCLLRVALVDNQVCFGSVLVVEPPAARAHWLSLVQFFATPWTLAHQAPLSMDFHAPLLENHPGSAAAPLPLAWLPMPCREHEVFCQETGVKSPSLCLEAERTRWEMLQREGHIL